MESDREAGKTPFQKSQKHSPHRRPMLVLQPIALVENICENVCNITLVVVVKFLNSYRRKGAVFSCK